MNINSMINKALNVLSNRGQIYKYNTFKFYSEQFNKYNTKHQLLKRKLISTKNGMQEKYQEVKTSYTNRDIFKYLTEELRRMD